MATTIIGQEVAQLKQTFEVTERYGVYITKIGLFFKSVSLHSSSKSLNVEELSLFFEKSK